MENDQQGVFAAERLLKKRFRKVCSIVFTPNLTSVYTVNRTLTFYVSGTARIFSEMAGLSEQVCKCFIIFVQYCKRSLLNISKTFLDSILGSQRRIFWTNDY